jgi:hypothetical protein
VRCQVCAWESVDWAAYELSKQKLRDTGKDPTAPVPRDLTPLKDFAKDAIEFVEEPGA